MSDKLINATNLKKSFDKFIAVDNIDLSVSRGEVVGFLGPNGAGKSTTMKMLTGFLEPDNGQIFINNINLKSDPLKAKEAGTKKTYFKDRYIIDTNFSSKLSEYLTEALEAKFSNEELKTLLLSTKDAKIVSFARANTPPVMTELMEVRKSMS